MSSIIQCKSSCLPLIAQQVNDSGSNINARGWLTRPIRSLVSMLYWIDHFIYKFHINQISSIPTHHEPKPGGIWKCVKRVWAGTFLVQASPVIATTIIPAPNTISSELGAQSMTFVYSPVKLLIRCNSSKGRSCCMDDSCFSDASWDEKAPKLSVFPRSASCRNDFCLNVWVKIEPWKRKLNNEIDHAEHSPAGVLSNAKISIETLHFAYCRGVESNHRGHSIFIVDFC